MTVTPTPATPQEQEQIRTIRGAARRAIWLPFIGGGVIILILTLLTLTFPDVRQTDLVANFLSIFVLCPAIICFLPVYILFVTAIYGMNKLNAGISKPLMRVERLTESVGERVADVSEKAARASITVNAKLASIDRAIFSIFDERPEDKGTTHGHSADKE